MIVVDSSVWIDLFRGRGSRQTQILDELLADAEMQEPRHQSSGVQGRAALLEGADEPHPLEHCDRSVELLLPVLAHRSVAQGPVSARRRRVSASSIVGGSPGVMATR